MTTIQTFFKHKHLETLINTINAEIVKIASWFEINKLSLNIKKTNFIIFSAKRKLVPPNNLLLLIYNIPVEQVDKTKFLGVVINSKLNSNAYITTVCTKVSKNTGIFKVRHNLNSITLLLLYRSLIQLYLDYCNIIWATGHSNNLERLLRKQTKNSSGYYICWMEWTYNSTFLNTYIF